MSEVAMTPKEIIDNYSRQLLPCPFCGGRAEIERVGETRWAPGCNDRNGTGVCIGYQALTTFARAGEAVEAWNKREVVTLASAGSPSGSRPLVGSIGEADDIAVGRQADAPNTFVTPSLLSDSREAIAAAGQRILKDIRGRKLLKWLFDDDPANMGVIGHVEAAVDLDTQRECVETWARLAIETALSLPQTGVEAEADPFERETRQALQRLAGMPDTVLKSGEGEPYQVTCSVVMTPARARYFLAALAPKGVDRDTEGDDSQIECEKCADVHPVDVMEEGLCPTCLDTSFCETSAYLRAEALSPSLHGYEK